MAKNKSLLKTSIFIDYSNVYIEGKKKYGVTIDPPKLISLLTKGKKIVHSYLFSSIKEDSEGQKRFFRKMRTKGIIVKTVPLVERPSDVYCPNCKELLIPFNCQNCEEEFSLPPHKSKRVDVLLTATLLRTCNTFDEAIVVCGDQDFIPAYKILREEEGKKVHIASFSAPLSGELHIEVDSIRLLDEDIKKICRDGESISLRC